MDIYVKEGRMKRLMITVMAAWLLAGGAAVAQESLIDSVAKGCEQELKSLCKDVTPGEGRGLACLYAFSDKLTPKCEYALYDAAAQLERVVNALAYTATECKDDLKTYCADTKPGQGRILQCMEKNEAKLSKRCK